MQIYLEDYFLKDNKQLELTNSVTLGDLLDRLDYKQHFTALVNGTFQPHSYVLKHGDVVSLLPVLSGG